ncbi:ML-like domain [Yamadazyma tenuis]|uniref:TRP-domain-containing protein n=1 Tax=Candida tenuis (strain ATCC 10573 / BCRC 21748 / CBS 615 / JCM 9827 / NBRC 10315 / NRRL Y-1498 / VKM Y-70) TaxID=590646 RepID=G3BD94_CANTC|nr:TRP-domain-containing protein [Yamadazyma tenuis ATCC 10573]EGV60272.1 TRP-domain-containing protein [Yamadazyma tenuis ATCC 10573]WEJ94485.1 ML-like domain [Yamadazyma tenuis]
MLFHMWTLLLWANITLATRSLMATSLVTCSEKSLITPSYFNVTFNPDDLSLRYNIDLTTDISGYVIGHVYVYAYGFLLIEDKIDLCSLGWKQFCPVYPGSLQIDSIQYISKKTAALLPGIAYQVPDIDAIVKVYVVDRDSGETLSCLQSSFSNGKTVSQVGAKWATAVIAGLGLLIAAFLSTFGNSNAASNVSANAVSLFLYFQSVVVVSMQSVDRLPPIASAWAENLAWSMGLIRVKFMQDIFRWYVQSTGGTPTTYFMGTTKQILVQRAYDYLENLHSYVKRGLEYSLHSNSNLIVLRGIKRIGYDSHIEPTSIVATGFTFFVLIGYLLIFILFILKQIVDLLIQTKKLNPNSFNYFRRSFGTIIKGTTLRYIYIGFTQLVILSLWEFTQNDSPAMIVLSVLSLLMVFAVIGWSLYRTFRVGKASIQQFNNPAALLYGDETILNKYGFCYTMFNASKYWFGTVIVAYNLIKGIFISLCQPAAKVSVVVVFVLDLAYTIYLFTQAPYLNKPTNIINYIMAIVITINSFLFMFFSDLFGQPAPVASIMAWVFFILNAAFSLILLLFIIVFSALSVLSKNPDARFAPAKDDRTSFQRMSSIKRNSQYSEEKTAHHSANELMALGVAAQDHTTNWEQEMYKLGNVSAGTAQPSSDKDILTPELGHEKSSEVDFEETEQHNSTESIDEPQSFLGARLKSLSRSLSKKKKTDNNANDGNLTRLSDTLMHEDSFSHPEPTISHQRNQSNYSDFVNNPTDKRNVV